MGRRHPGLGPARLACRCPLVEHADGLVVVDTGLGLRDAAEPPRAAPFVRAGDRPALEAGDAAISQLRRAGRAPRDVRHIVMAQLDFDRAGSLSDFPWATVPLGAQEARNARAQPGHKARRRWRLAQLPTGMAEHIDTGGEGHGLPTLRGTPDGIHLVPLPGHSPGHCGVAIRAADGGCVLPAGAPAVLHCELEGKGRVAPLARAYHAGMQSDGAQRRASAQRRRDRHRRSGAAVTILCTHDPKMPSSPRVNDLGAPRGSVAPIPDQPWTEPCRGRNMLAPGRNRGSRMGPVRGARARTGHRRRGG